jgi:hypothetical protein
VKLGRFARKQRLKKHDARTLRRFLTAPLSGKLEMWLDSIYRPEPYFAEMMRNLAPLVLDEGLWAVPMTAPRLDLFH